MARNGNFKEVMREDEDRYSRLSIGKRRPSLEYISPQEIRKIFFKYARDPVEFMKLSDQDMLQLYQEWYEGCYTALKDVPEEDPDIQDSAK